jgi:hypothetical protein
MMKKCLLTALAVLMTSTGLSAQIEAGPHRPGNVPAGYVVTPFGYFHPSCVQSIAEDEALLANGQVQHSDGSVTGKTTCSYPRYAPDGTPKVTTAKQQVPEVSGWIESESVTAPTNKSFSALYASSRVPSQPRAQDGQVLFFFPGFEDISNVESILQPVITWSAGQWTVSNWNCCLSGITTQSKPVNISPGDEIVSSITENCRPGTLSCATWNIFSLDTHTGKSTTLAKTPSEGQVFNWAFGGALEPYYVVNCDDYPRDGHESYQVIVFDERFIPIEPKWTVSVNTTATPQCGYKVDAKPFEVTLDY